MIIILNLWVIKMSKQLTDILSFDLTGKFACFKKFYSNKSSLTYKTIPRTVIAGIFASILEIERNEYYDLFSINNAKISVNVESETKTQFQCMNYLKDGGGRTQTRLEILMGKEENLRFRLYLAFKKNKSNIIILNEIEKKIKHRNLGYGIYLGQRQFRGEIEFIERISDYSIENNKSVAINFITNKENIIDVNFDKITMISSDLIALDFESIKSKKSEEILRLPMPKREIVFTQDGEKLFGTFKEVIKISEEKYISFFTKVGEL